MMDVFWFGQNGYGNPKGIVHVGANSGQEIDQYLKLVKNIIAIEPLPNCFQELTNYESKRVTCLNYALGEKEEIIEFNWVIEDDLQSSFLPLDTSLYAIPVTIKKVPIQVRRFDTLGIDLENYDCLVIDTQGTELEVLKGFGETLQEFRFIIVEVTDREFLPKVPFQTDISSDDIIEFLENYGFTMVVPKCGHCDVAFVRI